MTPTWRPLAPWRAIKAARIVLGLSQRDLAKAAGVSRGTIERIERGIPGQARVDQMVQEYLEGRGVVFVPEGEGHAGGFHLPRDEAKAE